MMTPLTLGRTRLERGSKETMKRVLIVAAVVGAFVPTPARADTVGGESGFELELWLMLAGFVAIVGALVYRGRQGSKCVVTGSILAVGVAIIAGSLVLPRVGDGTTAAGHVVVQIVQPRQGTSVTADRPIEVEAKVTGANVAQSASSTHAGHIHLFVDGDLQGMLYGESTEVELSPGAHTITVEYTDSHHLSFDPPITDSIEITAE